MSGSHDHSHRHGAHGKHHGLDIGLVCSHPYLTPCDHVADPDDPLGPMVLTGPVVLALAGRSAPTAMCDLGPAALLGPG